MGKTSLERRERGKGKGEKAKGKRQKGGLGLGRWGGVVTFTLLAGLQLPGCQREAVPLRNIQIQQGWALQSGGEVAGYAVSSGLGDITLELGGDRVQMPFAGEVQPTTGNCVVVSSPEVPAYLFRLCGVRRPRLGQRRQGQFIGHAQQLVFAALRKQPNGTWAMVEPSTAFVENLLSKTD